MCVCVCVWVFIHTHTPINTYKCGFVCADSVLKYFSAPGTNAAPQEHFASALAVGFPPLVSVAGIRSGRAHAHTHVRIRALGASSAQHAAGVTVFKGQDSKMPHGAAAAANETLAARAGSPHHCVQNFCPAAIPALQPEHCSAPGSMIAGGSVAAESAKKNVGKERRCAVSTGRRRRRPAARAELGRHIHAALCARHHRVGCLDHPVNPRPVSLQTLDTGQPSRVTPVSWPVLKRLSFRSICPPSTWTRHPTVFYQDPFEK